jgi:hypothetical protein
LRETALSSFCEVILIWENMAIKKNATIFSYESYSLPALTFWNVPGSRGTYEVGFE